VDLADGAGSVAIVTGGIPSSRDRV